MRLLRLVRHRGFRLVTGSSSFVRRHHTFSTYVRQYGPRREVQAHWSENVCQKSDPAVQTVVTGSVFTGAGVDHAVCDVYELGVALLGQPAQQLERPDGVDAEA